MIKVFKKIFISIYICFLLFSPVFYTKAQTIDLYGPSLLPKAELFVTPRTGNFIVGSTFEVPVYINTNLNRINTISLKIDFNPAKLAIVNPSGGKSIFGIWIQAPKYDNKIGTASMAGVIPGGITTSSGLIATITFKTIGTGNAGITISDYSSANLDDGLGTDVKLSRSGGFYTITPKAPEGVMISSETHPIQEQWYNNNSPILRWESLPNIQGFSIALDSSPNTIPPTNITTNDTSYSYTNLKNGIWYFHVRAIALGVWGNTTHFQIKIDTAPPANFSLDVSNLKDAVGAKKYLVSFLTTDTLAGIDHYEVGVVDNNSGEVASPVFIETQSPYLAPNTTADSMRVIVRAYDTAGNIREASVDLYPGFTFISFFKKYFIYLLLLILLIILAELLLHYLFGHHILDRLRRVYSIFKKTSVSDDNIDKIEKPVQQPVQPIVKPIKTEEIKPIIKKEELISLEPAKPIENKTIEINEEVLIDSIPDAPKPKYPIPVINVKTPIIAESKHSEITAFVPELESGKNSPNTPNNPLK